MSVTASQVAELRKLTNCGLMDCKKALEEAKSDIQKAVEILRKKGMAKAVKKADRAAMEGVVKIKTNEDNHQAVIIEVNCETDFVSRGIDFQQFSDQVVNLALTHQTKDLNELEKIKVAGDKTIEQLRQELIAKVGENIMLRRFVFIETEDFLGTYVHSGRIGVLVVVKGGDAELAKDIAMHIAASNPIVISPDEIDEDLLKAEREIYLSQAGESGKPQQIIEKMVEGRIKKFVNEVSLIGQPFVKDSNMSIQQLLESKKAQVVNFVRFELGEESKND